jgi:hypothetical protein
MTIFSTIDNRIISNSSCLLSNFWSEMELIFAENGVLYAETS